MSESDTMFNERDRRCAAVQHMLSTDPTYDNRTIASTLKMQIWIATNNRDLPRVMKTKFPATVMVFGVVSSEGHIMPPHIIEVGLKVNTKVYLDVLKRVVIPWCNQVAGGKPWVRQKDSTPAHKSKEAQAWFGTLLSGSVSRRWLRLKAATLNRWQLYYIIKLPELIFSIKVLKQS